MSQTVCPSCGASFMTPWPQCPICGSAIPSSTAAPPDMPTGFGQDVPDGSLISSEPFVPPAYDSPIPEPAAEKPKPPGGAASKSPPSPSPGPSFDFGAPPGGAFGGFEGFGAGAPGAASSNAPPALPAPAAPAPVAGGFDFDPASFAGMDFTAPAASTPAPPAPSPPVASNPAPSAPPVSFGQDDGPGFDPSSFKAFDFTALDSSSMAAQAPKPAAPKEGPPAPPPGLKGPALKGPPAFRGQPAPGGGPPGFSAPPAFRNPAGAAPTGSSTTLEAKAPAPLGGAQGLEATPKPGEPSSFADLNTPGHRPQARRGPPPGAVRNPNLPADSTEPTPLSDDKLSTAGLAPVRNDDKTLMEQALERQSAQRENQARTGLTTLLMITLMLLVFVAGAAFLMVQLAKPSLPQGTTPGPGAGGGTGQVPAPISTVVVTPVPGANPGVGTPGTGTTSTASREVIARCIDEIRNAPSDVRDTAARALAEVGVEAVPFLIPLLSDPKLDARKSAVDTLREIGPPAAEATQPLLEAFDEGPYQVQLAAAQAFMKIRGPGVAEGLSKSYTESASNPRKRKLIITVLDDLGAEAEPAVPSLVNGLQDADEGVRDAALSALKKVGVPAVPAVCNALRASQPAARTAACQFMATMEDEAAPAVPDLIAMLGDRAKAAGRTADVGLYAMHALSLIGPEAIEPLLKVFKTSEIDEVRERAATALGRIGPAALEPLIELVNAGSSREVLGAVMALEEMGPRAKSAMDALRAASAKYPTLRINIEGALRSIQK